MGQSFSQCGTLRDPRSLFFYSCAGDQGGRPFESKNRLSLENRLPSLVAAANILFTLEIDQGRYEKITAVSPARFFWARADS